MAPKTFTAPKVWRRPYTSIYNDNYRFGNSLYSSAVADIENRSKGYAPYFAAPPTGSVISDPGVRRAILEAELLTSSDILPTDLIESALSSSKASSNVKELNSSSAVHGSSSLTKSDLSSSSYSRSILEQTTTTTTTSQTPIGGRRASDSLNFTAYSSAKELANLESELEQSRARRRRHVTSRPTTIYVSGSGLAKGRSSSPLFSQLHDSHLNASDSLDAGSTPTKDWSLERWYAKAVRNAHKVAVFPLH